MKAIIVAGGLGTRLRPLTDTTPKPLLPIKGKPILEYHIKNLKQQGITEIVFALSFHADKIQDYFGDGTDFGVHITYSLEETPLGTGGAVKQANAENKDSFILLWGDNLIDIDVLAMKQVFDEYSASLVMALTPREDVEHFGVAKLDGNKIISFIEKPRREEAPSNLINAGAFIVDPKILSLLPEGKSSLEKDCFEKVVLEGRVFAYEHKGQWFPTDTIEKYAEANEQFQI